ncbi:MAG TPA: DUF3016 domain-containing protein [Opitutaceae bacterium]|nr:DUF3016 domain-containing protein [Opitutaceae bacterium]
MKTLHLLLAFATLTVAAVWLRADPAADKPAGLVDVTYVNPEKFTDVKDSDVPDDRVRDEYLKELKTHIETHAKEYIPAGWHLNLKITDVDMAGDFEPWRGPQFLDMRIVKDVYPPRIKLEFALTDPAGKTVKEGQRNVTNLSFLNEINIYFPDDQLRYEKALLDYWFRQEFGSAKKVAASETAPAQ